MKEIIISKNDADQRVDKFLQKSFPDLPKSFMYKSIRNKKIKVNRKRCEISQRLEEGDVVHLFVSDEMLTQKRDMSFLSAKRDLSVVYEDDNIIVIDKPSGLLVHPDIDHKEDTLIQRLLAYLYDKNEFDVNEMSFTPALVHRLDRNTSGLIIAAKNAMALRECNQLMKDRKIEKYYIAEVEGYPQPSFDQCRLFYKKDKEKNMASIVNENKEGYDAIALNYKVLEQRQKTSLVEVELITGKSHQIRAVFSYLGYPIVGDVKYNAAKTKNKEYQKLMSYRIVFHVDNKSELAYLDNKEIRIEHTF